MNLNVQREGRWNGHPSGQHYVPSLGNLQLTGKARVVWDSRLAAASGNVERWVEFEIEEVIQLAGATRLRYRFVEYSPFNPAEATVARTVAQAGDSP